MAGTFLNSMSNILPLELNFRFANHHDILSNYFQEKVNKSQVFIVEGSNRRPMD